MGEGQLSKLSKFYPEIEDKCDCCAQSPADPAHMFWSCPKLISFWSFYFEILSEVIGVELPPDAGIAIFGVPDTAESFTSKQLHLIAFSSLLVCRRILLLWKSPAPLTSSSLLEHLMMFLKLEKIYHSWINREVLLYLAAPIILF